MFVFMTLIINANLGGMLPLLSVTTKKRVTQNITCFFISGIIPSQVLLLN